MDDNLLQTILVVDDIPENIDVLSGVLRDEYKVRFALNGKMALKIIEKTMPDLILLDIMMPEMDGYEVCKIIKENPLLEKIPVIFVTAKEQIEDELYGFEIGAVDYITKPINPVLVKRRVKTHLALANQQLELEKQVMEKTKVLSETKLEIIKKLGIAAEYRDNETGAHIERMSNYCYYIALEYGMDEKNADILKNASPMHDVGKIGIPDMILKKPGKLSKEEMDVMKSHTKIGAKILGEHKSGILYYASKIALEHHEHYDGNGYPNGLKGDDIHIFSRITAIADVYDALMSKRPYKEPWNLLDTIEFIKDQRGKMFDPAIVDCFFNIIEQLEEIRKSHNDE